jgi:hypothetical protein
MATSKTFLQRDSVSVSRCEIKEEGKWKVERPFCVKTSFPAAGFRVCWPLWGRGRRRGRRPPHEGDKQISQSARVRRPLEGVESKEIILLSEPQRAASARRTATATTIRPHARQKLPECPCLSASGRSGKCNTCSIYCVGGLCKERKVEKCILINIHLI